ncbi:multiple sugar transport system substrate-binding protein [Enhydrobacter aerosaccus]|uniref:Multiple sugar transport system substrate-binding protein n=1 Tax=Enhydrobacter aerosaccus TaxID=225324 RepID=A0A1T4PMF9_9HYPH|nr:sugar ABC transporter substrate-binding protein [Enhydrobacter aerosaccus]SJZ92774.1 multiple sugar transport system substrate-binding protein [Enhydrobacter aerosaccus]
MSKGFTTRAISRRRALQGAAALGGLAAPMLNSVTAYSQSGGFDWKRFKGQEVEVLMETGPRADLMKKYKGEFKDLTGIELGIEVIPEQQARQKVAIELNSGKPSFDLFNFAYHVQKRQFEKGGWLLDITSWLKDPQMMPAEYELGDVSKLGMSFATTSDGKVNSLPILCDYFILYYNKDLFAKKGVAVPKTLDEMMAAAAKINDPAAGISGFVGRGVRNANVVLWTQLLSGWGQETIKGTKLITDTPDAIASAEYYKKLLSSYAPQGVAGFNWNEAQGLFIQGKAGMWIDATGFAAPIEDKTKSRVVGKVGYALPPSGPKGHGSVTFGSGMAIPKASTHKEAAYLTMLWMTGPKMAGRMLQVGGGIPFRTNPLKDPAVLAGLTIPREWAECAAGCAPISMSGLPVIVPVTEFRDVIGTALTNMLGGADPATELKRATTEFQPVIDKSEQT